MPAVYTILLYDSNAGKRPEGDCLIGFASLTDRCGQVVRSAMTGRAQLLADAITLRITLAFIADIALDRRLAGNIGEFGF